MAGAQGLVRILDAQTPVPALSLPGFSFGRVRQVPHRALVNRAARRLGHPASIPRAIMSRSPEALALGPAVISFRRRYHCPSFGCLLNRSRDCTRSRVPPSFHAGVVITAPRRVPLLPLLSAPFGLPSLMRKKAELQRKQFSQRIAASPSLKVAASILRARADHAARRAETKNRTFVQ
jgi:hypothetical protein